MVKTVRVKMEVRRYVEEIYWIDEEIEIPDGEENIEEYLKDGIDIISVDGIDLDNSQITIQEEIKTIQLVQEIQEIKEKPICKCQNTGWLTMTTPCLDCNPEGKD